MQSRRRLGREVVSRLHCMRHLDATRCTTALATAASSLVSQLERRLVISTVGRMARATCQAGGQSNIKVKARVVDIPQGFEPCSFTWPSRRQAIATLVEQSRWHQWRRGRRRQWRVVGVVRFLYSLHIYQLGREVVFRLHCTICGTSTPNAVQQHLQPPPCHPNWSTALSSQL